MTRSCLLILVSLPLLLSCSAFQKRKSQPTGPAEFDVPFQARPSQSGFRKRLMVLPFIDEKIGRSDKVAKAGRAAVVRELARSGQFVLVNPEDLPKDVSQFITKEREYDMEKVSRMAGPLGIAAVMEGKILEVRAHKLGDSVGLFRKVKARVETLVRLRVFATKNGKEILNDTRSAKVETSTTEVGNSRNGRKLEEDPRLVQAAVTKAFRGGIRLIVKAVDKVSWEGRVAMISGERVYINAGRLSGIQIGDILKVTEDPREVFDPETGRFIGHAPGRMKGTVEITSYFGKDGAVGVVHSGAGFKENDRVELY